jgi:hypothetical protein
MGSFLLSSIPALAQLETGSVTGRVTDTTGAVIPNAKVTLVNKGTNMTLAASTNVEGFFNFSALQPGTYQVTAKFKGFEQSSTTVELTVGDTARADLTLHVGSDKATITVYSGGAYELETQNANVDFVVTKQEVLDLPLNGGNPYGLAALSPGINPLGAFGSGLTTARGALQTVGNANFSTNGGIPGSNEILLDGVPITVCCNGQPALTPSIAIVDQLRIISSVPPAQYGRTSGGILNYSTFSGQNRVHGQVFEFFQNTKLHAAPYFAKADDDLIDFYKPGDYRLPLQYNQYGIGIGGPIVIPHLYHGRDKTFFFAGFAGINTNTGSYSKLTVPTAKMRTGDISEACLYGTNAPSGNTLGSPDPSCNPANDLAQTLIYDPSTSTNATTKRSPFPYNKITNIDPTAAMYLQFFPRPNDKAAIATGATINNYDNMTINRRVDRQFSIRFDHEYSTRQRILVRGTYTYNHDHIPDEFGSYSGPNSRHQNIAAVVGALQDTWMLSNKSVLALQYGFAYQRNSSIPGDYNYTAADGGFSTAFAGEQQVSGLPSISLETEDSIGNTQILHNDKYTHAVGANLTTQLGAHTVVTGIDFRDMIFNTGDLANPAGTFSFGPMWVTGPLPNQTYTCLQPPTPCYATTIGMERYTSFADFLLGLPTGGSITLQRRVTDTQQYGALFIQDNWRASANLTLNLGVRYDVETGPEEKHNRYATFDPTVANPVSAKVGFPVTGGLDFRGTAGHSRHFFNTYWTQFSPRVGFIYSLNPETVLRGGFGILNMPTSQRLYGIYNGAEQTDTDFPVTASQVVPTPGVSFANPYLTGLNQIPDPSQGGLANIGTDVGGLVYNTPYSYVEQWHINLQQTLATNFIFSLSYVGTHGVKLPLEFEANDLRPNQFSFPGDSVTAGKLSATVANLFYGLAKGGIYASPTIVNSYMVDRYPQFQAVREDYVGQGGSRFDALQAVLRKGWKNGASLNITYTWSKGLGDVDDLTTGFIDTGTPGWQNSYFPKQERSYSTIDIPQRLVTSFVGRVPYGHGQAFGKTIPRWQQAVFGNWQVNGIVAFQSGLPLNIGETGQALYGGSRPLVVPGQAFKTGGSIRQRLGGTYSANGYFNPAAFKLTSSFQFGNITRLCALCRALGTQNVDASLFKIVQINQTFSMQIRGEMFNVLNSVQFAAPNTTFNGSTFGDITSQSNNPRTIQLAVRIIW